MILYVLRHAEKTDLPEWNPEKGFDDRRLNNHGHQQANSIVDFFKDKSIKRIYTSEYTRTDETIRPLYLKENIEVQVDGLLNEIDVGTISDPSISKTYHDELVSGYQKCIDEERDFTYVGGESGFAVFKRIETFLEKMETTTGNTVAVSHEGWIKLLICHLLHADPGKQFRIQIETCGLLELEPGKAQGIWKIRLSSIA